MDIILYAVGKTNTRFVEEGLEEYIGRLKRYIPFKVEYIKDIKGSGQLPEQRQKELEGHQILDRLQSYDTVILLDEHGKEYSSREFAGWIEKQRTTGRKRLVFVIGGPYGFSPEVYERAHGKISLSQMTFNHEMVRLFFVEQIYRAMTILRGEPYHHD